MKAVTLYKLVFIVVLGLVLSSLFCSRNKTSITGAGDDETPPDTVTVRKPNIYIYPEEITDLTVRLAFPLGGRVTASEPAYPDSGWQVTVTTNGIINSAWHFLFYECDTPNLYQTDEGWLVARSDLENFFESSLLKYGMNEQEINDFKEYWLPRLTEHEYYLVYPQTREIVDLVIDLQLSRQPDNLLRLFYYFRGTDKNSATKPIVPYIEHVKRSGFTVIEWGGILE